MPKAHQAIDGLTRKRVARHAQSCATCEPRWNSSPNALGILAAAPLLGVPAGLKAKVLDDPRLISSSRPLGGGNWRADGFPPVEQPDRRRRLILSVAAALLFVVVAVGLVFAGNDDTPKLATPVVERETTTTTELASAALSTTAPTAATTTSGRRTTTTRRVVTSTTRRPGANPGGPAVIPTTVAAPPTTQQTGLRITSTNGPSRICAGDAATFTATVEGANPPRFMFLNYSSGNDQNAVGMQRNGNTYTANIILENLGDYTWRVSGGGATSAAKSFSVVSCPR